MNYEACVPKWRVLVFTDFNRMFLLVALGPGESVIREDELKMMIENAFLQVIITNYLIALEIKSMEKVISLTFFFNLQDASMSVTGECEENLQNPTKYWFLVHK